MKRWKKFISSILAIAIATSTLPASFVSFAQDNSFKIEAETGYMVDRDGEKLIRHLQRMINMPAEGRTMVILMTVLAEGLSWKMYPRRMQHRFPSSMLLITKGPSIFISMRPRRRTN